MRTNRSIRWTAMALMAVVSASTAIGSSASSAQAMDIGGIGRPAQVASVSTMESGCTRGRVLATPYVTPDTGYSEGQYVAYRIHVANNRGWAHTYGWSQWQFARNNNFYAQPLASTVVNAQLSSRYWAWVQVARWTWTGSRWETRFSGWIPSTYSGYAGVGTVECYT